jgi:hypothetical protein
MPIIDLVLATAGHAGHQFRHFSLQQGEVILQPLHFQHQLLTLLHRDHIYR